MEVGVTEVFFLFLQPLEERASRRGLPHISRSSMHGRVSLSVTLSRELDAGPMGFGFAAR